jgi:hypothetical protein
LKDACPKQLHDRILISLASPRRLYLWRPVLLHHRLLLSVWLLFPLRRRSAPPQCPVPHLLQPTGSFDYMFRDFLSKNLIYALFARSSASQKCSHSWAPPFDAVCGWCLYSRNSLRAFPTSILEHTSFRASPRV